MSRSAASPYSGLEPRAFWKSGVAEAGAFPPPDFWRPKFRITRDDPIMTAGSCFAQHVGRALKQAGCNVIDTEPLPAGIPDPVAQAFGYRLYSARYGNIYTPRQLRQLIGEANGTFQPALPVWTKGDGFVDALRPGVEPEGLDRPELVAEARARHLARVRAALSSTRVLVFTLGLTEAWEHAESGTVYPSAPGTVAGEMSDAFRFVNFRQSEICADLLAVRDLLLQVSPGARMVLSVSPVPLIATASGDHVLSATGYSKAVLRAAAGELAASLPDVDYFPAYEIVTSPAAPEGMFAANLRSVSARGVDLVMQTFLAAQGLSPEPPQSKPPATRGRRHRRAARRPDQTAAVPTAADLVCEEVLLEAFVKE